MGPYSKKQLEQLLKTREFMVLDEISQAFGRWHCVKDVPAFAKAVEELRIQNIEFSSNDTVSTTLDATDTITLTEPIHNNTIEDFTDNISTFSKDMDEIVYDNIDDDVQSKAKPSNDASVKSFGYKNDTVIAQQAQETARFAWLVTGALLFCVVAFTVYNHFMVQPTQKRGDTFNIKNMAMEAMAIGDYEVALEHFQKAYRLDPDDKGIYVYLGTLLIQLRGQTVEGRRRLQEVVASNMSPKLSTNALGVADLIDGDLQSADEKFMRALKQDTYYAPAKINLGASALQKGEYQRARDWLYSVIDQGTDEAVAYLMLAEANINLFHQQRHREFLEHGQKQLTRLMQMTYDYYQEAALVLAYIDYLTGDLNKLKRKIELILDVDPNLTDDHRHNLFVYHGRASWLALSNWCIQITKALGATARAKALRSYCLFKGGKEVEAVKWADDAATQGIRDPLVQAVYAYILDGVGQAARASVTLTKANELNYQAKLALPMILQGRLYDRANRPNLAFEKWQQIYSLDKRSVVGVAGISQSYFNMKNYSKAQSYLLDGLLLSRSYRPLIRLKKEAEHKGIFLPKDSF